jgi:hypothetical protein
MVLYAWREQARLVSSAPHGCLGAARISAVIGFVLPRPSQCQSMWKAFPYSTH